VAEDRRENPFAVEAVERIGVGVADAGRLDLDQDFAGLGSFQIKLDDFKRLLRLKGNCGPCLHHLLLLHHSPLHTIQYRYGSSLTGLLIPVELVSAWLAASGLSSCEGGRPPGMALLARARR